MKFNSKFLVGVMVLALNFSLHAQDKFITGNQDVIQQQRSIESFNKLVVELGVDVSICTGDPGKVDIECESNILPHIIVACKNGELTLGLSKDIKIRRMGKVKLRIHGFDLKQIVVKTGCFVTAEQPIQVDSLLISLASGSVTNLPIKVSKLNLLVETGSKAELSGSVTEANIRLREAGMLEASKLIILHATISLTGVSKATLYVSKTLSASASDFSSLIYSGDSVVDSKRVSGMSDITHSK